MTQGATLIEEEAARPTSVPSRTATVIHPRTTVIITSYNYGEYLPDAIRSALNQTDRDFELLIVDDGSTDRSIEIAERCEDPRVRIIARAHAGLGATRNAGIRHACGRYVTFLDADDVWAPEKLERQCAFLDGHPHIALVYSRFGVLSDQGRVQSEGHALLTAKPSGDVFRYLLRGNLIGAPSTICMRREILGDEGIEFDESNLYVEDWHFYLRLALNHEIAYLPHTLAYHRSHSRNMQGTIDSMRDQSLRTIEFATELARERFDLDARGVETVERRLLAYREAITGREFVKAGDLSRAALHAKASLRHRLWNPTELLIVLLASVGWMPKAFSKRLK